MWDSKPNRRRVRFTLRTLFVALTVFGCWLGYEVNWIRQRNELRAEKWVVGLWGDSDTRAPFMLRLLGESGEDSIGIIMVDPKKLTPLDRVRAARVIKAFPESVVYTFYPSSDSTLLELARELSRQTTEAERNFPNQILHKSINHQPA